MSRPRARAATAEAPLDQWLEVFVYAPLGFALDARQLFPEFVDRGRSQVVLARVVGKYAVQHGQTRRPSAASSTARTQVVGGAPGARLAARRSTSRTTRRRRRVRGRAVDLPTSRRRRPRRAAAADRRPDRASATAAPPDAEPTLAIPDYDNLSASQVVPRLEGLDRRRARGRARATSRPPAGRKTILNKIAQLQSA